MSTSPYSLDLREKVIKYLQLGNNQESAARIFMLNPSTVSRWWLRYKIERGIARRGRGWGLKSQKLASKKVVNIISAVILLLDM